MPILALFLCAAVSGCSRSGDFGAFIVTEVAKHGGHAVTNATLPTLHVQWTIKSDANGFQASVSGAPFASIDAVMQQAFGTSKLSEASDLEGRPHRVWGAVDVGAAIQLIGRTDGAEIICIRGFRDMGEMLKSK
ncbi:MAG TPA: hypothetical protein VMR33_09115 [Candidatus Baltobacteraceae bacterium]|nr:hypothetical protein [Candidatus Baltobacteraceae bacterium]